MKRLVLLPFLLGGFAASAQIAARQAPVPITADGGALVLVYPTAPQPRDTLVALFSLYSGATLTPPTGWTQAFSQSIGTVTIAAYTHPVGAAEANSYTFTQDNHATGEAWDLSGAAYYSPLDGAAAVVATASSASITTPALTPAKTGDFPLSAVAADYDGLPTAVASPWTGVFSSHSHPLAAASAPLTTDTTTPVSATYTLSSASTNGVGAATLLIKPYDPTPIAPVVDAGQLLGYSSLAGLAIPFDGSATHDPKLETLTYLWTFGDGSTSTAVSPAHTYAAAGSYTASLQASNTDGLSTTVSFPVIIQTDCSGVQLGNLGALNGYVPGPADMWHRDITNASVDPLSNAILVTNGNDLAGYYLHPDFGGAGAYGIPYTVVDSSVTPKVPVNIDQEVVDAPEFDIAVFPIPDGMPVESSPPDCGASGDNHAILFDKHTCALNEFWLARSCSTNTPHWTVGDSTIWDTTITTKRPYGVTSVDAAGLSVFEGLVRYDEIVAGVINHAIRFTAKNTKQDAYGGYFTVPATHASGILYGVDNVEGMRLRLKASYDISGFTSQAKIIATAMKKYGMILADNGGNLYFQGTPDLRWNDDDLNALKGVPASAFEVVDGPGQGPLASSYAAGTASFYPNGVVYDSVNHPTGPMPANTLTASATSITQGQTVTLTPAATNGSLSYIDNFGFVRPGLPITVTPLGTTVYTLTTRNLFGTATSQPVTVTVQQPAAPRPPFFWGR